MSGDDDAARRLAAERDPVTAKTLAEMLPLNPDEGRRAWRRAQAEKSRRQRNKRGRRNRDPYRDYRGVRKQPRKEQQ